MPGIFDTLDQPKAPASGGGVFSALDAPSAPTSSGPSTGAMVAGGAGLAALGAMGMKAAQAPGGLAGKSVAMLGQLNALRQQLMLSGLALPKSILGGVGATVANSLERKSLSPLKALFSGETARDVGQAFKAGRQVGPIGSGTQLPAGLDLPGRTMGAFDDAIQKSLVRGGNTSEEATRALLQAPLEGRLGKALENPTTRYLFPFRRTPFNGLIEGGVALGEHPAISAGVGALGAVQGAAQADDQYPLTAGLGVAASAKYGFSNAVGQVAGRYMAGGRGGGGVAGSALPVSEYGLESGVTDPLRPFKKPAAVSFFEKMGLLPKSR